MSFWWCHTRQEEWFIHSFHPHSVILFSSWIISYSLAFSRLIKSSVSWIKKCQNTFPVCFIAIPRSEFGKTAAMSPHLNLTGPSPARGLVGEQRGRGPCRCIINGVWFSLQLLHIRAFGVHVRVEQRVSGDVAVRRGRVVVGQSAFLLQEAAAARVQTQIWKLGRRIRLLAQSVVVKVVDVHKPLRPEFPADSLTVHGQVDELACTDEAASVSYWAHDFIWQYSHTQNKSMSSWAHLWLTAPDVFLEESTWPERDDQTQQRLLRRASSPLDTFYCLWEKWYY